MPNPRRIPRLQPLLVPTLALALVSLPACGPAPLPEPSSAPAPPANTAVPAAPGFAALSDRLPSDLARSTGAAYAQALAQLREAPTEQNLCAVVHSARLSMPVIGSEMSTPFAELITQEDPSAPLAEWGQLLGSISRELPGIGLREGAEGAFGYVDYEALAGQTQADAAGLLQEFARIWPKPEGWPVYLQQQTDLTGCADPGALVAPMQSLASRWSSAPACLQQELAQVLEDSLAQISQRQCFCATREQATADVAALASRFRSVLPQSEGIASALEASPAQAGVQFNCSATN